MRLAVILLALLQLAALVLLGAEFVLTAGTEAGPSQPAQLLGLALAVVLPFAGMALWLAARNRALPFALALVLALPVALALILLAR